MRKGEPTPLSFSLVITLITSTAAEFMDLSCSPLSPVLSRENGKIEEEEEEEDRPGGANSQQDGVLTNEAIRGNINSLGRV